MGRKNAATFGAFEPVEDSFQDDMVITCTDFEVLSNGNLGSRTEYLRNPPSIISIAHAAEQHRPSSTTSDREDAIDANLCEEEFYSAAFQTTLFRLVIDCMGNREDPYTDGLLDYIRKQWMRAKDIRDRWCEEVELIKEEQKRVLCFLGYQMRWWIEQKPPKHEPCIVDEVASGQDAFAARQVAFYRSLYQRFAAMWGMISPDSKRTSRKP